MGRALGEDCTGLISGELGVPIEDLVDARDRMARNGPNLLANTAVIMQSRDARVTQNAHRRPARRDAQRVVWVMFDGRSVSQSFYAVRRGRRGVYRKLRESDWRSMERHGGGGRHGSPLQALVADLARIWKDETNEAFRGTRKQRIIQRVLPQLAREATWILLFMM